MAIIFKKRKARSIKKALKYFDPRTPLCDDKKIEAFSVDREGFNVDEIVNVFRRSNNYPKILFSGPPGCGKSTELFKIGRLLRKKYYIVQISAKAMTNNYEIKPEVVLYNIIKNIGVYVKERNRKYFDEKLDPLIKRFQGWQTKKVNIDADHKKTSPSMIEKIIKLEEAYEGSLESDSKLFKKPTANELILGINDAVKELERWRYIIIKGKRVLLLISDMDKIELESAREIFIKSFLCLVKINCNAIYTFPVELKYDHDFLKMFRSFSGIYYLENFEIIDKSGKISEENRRKLAEVIKKRISDKIIYQDVIEKIVDLSGGILFEFVNIVRECCVIALREKINYIDDDILIEAENRIRTNYILVLSTQDLKNLYVINQTKKIPETTNLTTLLNQYVITEYGSGENVWYDVNPILLPLLENLESEED